MSDLVNEQRAYTAAGPWDRLGTVLRVIVAGLFLLITVVFFATAQDGLVSVGDQGTGAVKAAAAPVDAR